MDGQAVQAINPAILASQIIDSPRMQEQWDARYKEGVNPATKRASEISGLLSGESDWKDILSEHPKLLKFMQEFVALQRGALHSRILPMAEGKDLRNVKAGLEVIAAELASVLPRDELPELRDLPQDMQDILNMEALHTAQKPFQPLRDTGRALGAFLHHLNVEVYEHRDTVIPAAVIMSYITYQIVAGIGVSSTAYTPDEVQTEICSFEDHLAGRTGDQCQSTITIDSRELLGNCHAHLAPVVFNYEPAVNLLVNMGAERILGPDCTTVSTFGQDAADFLLTGYDANLNRHQQTIGNPVAEALQSIERIGLKAAQDPEEAREVYRDTIQRTIDNVVRAVNKYDVYENLVLHGGITALVGLLTAVSIGKNGMPTHRTAGSAFARAGRGSWNLTKKLASIAPFTSSGAIVGGAYPGFTQYFWEGNITTGTLNPNVILYGLAAAFAGAAVEKTYRYTQRRNHIRAMTVDVKDQLTALAQSHVVFSDAPALSHKPSLRRPALITAFTVAAAYAAVNADFMMTNGQLTGHTLGTALPVLGFLSSNSIIDFFAHKGFAGVGAGFGMATGTAILLTNYAGNIFRKKENRIRFWRASKEGESATHHEHEHHHGHDCGHSHGHDHNMTMTKAVYQGTINVGKTINHMVDKFVGRRNFDRAVEDYVQSRDHDLHM